MELDKIFRSKKVDRSQELIHSAGSNGATKHHLENSTQQFLFVRPSRSDHIMLSGEFIETVKEFL